VFAAVVARVPREDRDPDARVLSEVTGDQIPTQIQRSCRAAGVPAFSPRDPRHQRASLLHAQGIPRTRVGEMVGHDALTAARTYTHVLADETEVDFQPLIPSI